MLKIFVDQLREEPGAFELDVRPQEIDLPIPYISSRTASAAASNSSLWAMTSRAGAN
jgi:hypothetical protein